MPLKSSAQPCVCLTLGRGDPSLSGVLGFLICEMGLGVSPPPHTPPLALRRLERRLRAQCGRCPGKTRRIWIFSAGGAFQAPECGPRARRKRGTGVCVCVGGRSVSPPAGTQPFRVRAEPERLNCIMSEGSSAAQEAPRLRRGGGCRRGWRAPFLPPPRGSAGAQGPRPPRSAHSWPRLLFHPLWRGRAHRECSIRVRWVRAGRRGGSPNPGGNWRRRGSGHRFPRTPAPQTPVWVYPARAERAGGPQARSLEDASR